MINNMLVNSFSFVYECRKSLLTVTLSIIRNLSLKIIIRNVTTCMRHNLKELKKLRSRLMINYEDLT